MRPNILLIMADQMTAKMLSMYGNGPAKTPALQALAERGVVFENAYCNFPLCGPSRQSMMAGRLPSRCGAYDNAAPLASDIPTFAHYLNAAGYRTCLSGKMHFVGPDQLHGYQERLTTDVYPADYSWTANWTDRDQKIAFQNMDNVLNPGPCARSMQLDYDEDAAYQAQRWLFDRARDAARPPWHLTVSFTHPHDPYQMTSEFWDLYETVDMPLPAIGPSDQTDPHSARLKDHYSIAGTSISEDQLRRLRHGYCAAISYIDSKVAQLMDVLQATGMEDNTVVVFTSDHGDMMGEHGLFYKKSFREWSMRIPLIIAGPNIAPRRAIRPVSLVDLLPTFCELSGQNPIETDGSSLLSDAQNPVCAEYLAEGVFDPWFMLRHDHYKLVLSPIDPPLLFDLAQDPEETLSVADDASYADILGTLLEQANQIWDMAQVRRDVVASQDRRRILQVAEHAKWDHAPDLSQKDRYVRAGKWTTEVEAAAFLPKR